MKITVIDVNNLIRIILFNSRCNLDIESAIINTVVANKIEIIRLIILYCSLLIILSFCWL